MRLYRCGELWSCYWSTGTAELHSTPKIKVTDFYWRHLKKKNEVTVCFYRDNCGFSKRFPNSILTRSVLSQSMFSSFRSLWAMPEKTHPSSHDEKKALNLFSIIKHYLNFNLPFVCKKSRACAMSLTTLLASSSLKCFWFWMCVRMEPAEKKHVR